MIKTTQQYFDIFGVSLPQLNLLLGEALARGGDYSDIYFENTTYGNLTLRDGAVTSGGQHIDFGVGIRVVSNEKTGYAYSESTGMKEMTEAARAAAAIADGAQRVAPVKISGVKGSSDIADRYPVSSNWRSTGAVRYLPFLEKLDAAVRSRDKRVVKVLAMLSWQVSDILMYNSFSELKYDTRPMGSVTVSVVFQQGDKVCNGGGNSIRKRQSCRVRTD